METNAEEKSPVGLSSKRNNSFTDPAIVLSMFMLLFIFFYSIWVFSSVLSGNESLQVFYRLFVCVLPLEIQLSRRGEINLFNLATFVCLSLSRTWFYVICRGLFCVQ